MARRTSTTVGGVGQDPQVRHFFGPDLVTGRREDLVLSGEDEQGHRKVGQVGSARLLRAGPIQ